MSNLAAHYMRKGDRRPYIRSTLTDEDGAVNLAGETVTFTLRDTTTGALKVSGAAAIVIDAANGVVEYRWQAGDTDTAGLYEATWRSVNGVGEAVTYPNVGAQLVQVYDPESGYVTVAELRQYLGLGDEPSDDHILAQTIDDATGMVATALGRDYALFTLEQQANIRMATRNLSAWMYRRRDTGSTADFDQASVSQTGAVLLPPSWPRDVRMALDPLIPKLGAATRIVRGKIIYTRDIDGWSS